MKSFYGLRLSALLVALLCTGCLPPSLHSQDTVTRLCRENTPSAPLSDFITSSQNLLQSFEQNSTHVRREALAALQHIRSLTDTRPPENDVLVWQQGDIFPSVWLRPTGGSASLIRLDPYIRGNNFESLSRIIISPSSSKIGVIARRRGTSANALLIIQNPSLASSIFDLDAYDAAWLGDEDLLVSTREKELPHSIFHIGGDSKPFLLAQAHSNAEALLLHQSRDGASVFVEHSLPHAVSIDLVSAQHPRQLNRLIDSDLPGSSCVLFKQKPLCLSFRNHAGGQLVQFLSIQPLRKKILDSGSSEAPYVDIDASENIAVGIISHGTSSEARIFEEGSPSMRSIHPLGPTTTLSARKVRNFENALMLRAESFLSSPYVRPLREISASTKPLASPILNLCDGCSESALVARSKDGTAIPISLVSPKNPLGVIVQVYGAYGVPSYATYSPATISLLAHGIAVAIAHIRGGGELGPSWHTQTLGEKKVLSVDDIRAATTHLQHVLRLSSQQTILSGRSAGALLVSTAAFTTPGLCGSLILDAPLLDLARIISDPSLPLYEREVYEWGSIEHAPLVLKDPLPRALPPLNMVLHVPLQDELIPPETTLGWAHRALCALHPSSVFLVYISKTSGHAGPSSRADQDEWSSLAEVFARTVISRPATE